MERVVVDGAELAALALGPTDAPPVVMLHGLVFGNIASWYSAIALPLAANRRVILYDQRAHGDSSPAASGFDLDHQARDLGAVLDHFGVGGRAVDLVGHSMGALIALRFALTAPDRIRRLVLVDAPMPAAEHVGPSLKAVRTPADLATYVAMAGKDGLRGRRLERLRALLTRLLFETSLVADVLAMGSESAGSLALLDGPVLLIYGLDSPCREAGRTLARALPGAILREVPGGHYLTEEAPAALVRLIEDFLSAQADPAIPT